MLTCVLLLGIGENRLKIPPVQRAREGERERERRRERASERERVREGTSERENE